MILRGSLKVITVLRKVPVDLPVEIGEDGAEVEDMIGNHRQGNNLLYYFVAKIFFVVSFCNYYVPEGET